MSNSMRTAIKTPLFLLALFLFGMMTIAMRPPGPLEIGLILLISLITMPLYFLPTILAVLRHKDNKLTVFLINLLLGWSLIGWIAALILSLSKNSQQSKIDQTVVVSQNIGNQTKNEGQSPELNKDDKYLEIAKERYAKGEISQVQYEQIKKEFS